jgi:sortase A
MKPLALHPPVIDPRAELLRAWAGRDRHSTSTGTATTANAKVANRQREWLSRVGRVLGSRRVTLALGTLLAVVGFGGAGYVEAKAQVAQVLLRNAWQRTLDSGHPSRPWPWADTRPVARLWVPRLAIDQIVLTGASGRTLAFGPALSTGAAMPGDIGNAIVSGHRDTHFQFLQYLSTGDRVWLETQHGRYAYAITGAEVVDSRYVELSTHAEDARLTLVTCYPFNAVVPGGPLRYVVSARLVTKAGTS